ncbi:MAG: energy transducer TonB [Thiogranum sp.]
MAGSLLLHALLVGLWQTRTPAGPSAHSTFQVTLLARHGDAADTPRSARQTAPAQPPEQPVTNSAESTAAATPAATRLVARLHTVAGSSGNTNRKNDTRAIAETRRTTAQERPSHAQQKPVSTRDGSTSHGRHELTSAARYRKTRSALLEALLPHFDYPPLARRRGWQGRVNVGLHVAADGDLTRIRLVKSSGYALLDRAAVRNITELRSIPHAARWLEGNGMDLVLPVRYQLAD